MSENPAAAIQTGAKAGFRADIEGLRAIAIFAVVFAHANVPYFQGGFIGVDLFFVLSGYLISGLLVREIVSSGKIKFSDFYARRFKRLLPGLMLMLIVVSAAASLILSPLEQITQTAALKAASLWMSNIYFSVANFGYFGASVDESLFLHTWSLGVEEQFYLLWPLLVLYFMQDKADTIAVKRSKLLGGFISIFVVCLLFCSFLSVVSPIWAFYSMPSRGWQFALGALVFLLSNNLEKPGSDNAHSPQHHSFPQPYASAAWLGLLLIAGSIVFIREDMVYPGGWALLPSAGAALLLYAGTSTRPVIVSRMLGSKPMRAIGRLSYSWYLWHWPVLVLGNIIIPDAGLAYQLLLVLVSLLCALCAYVLVEAPVRASAFLQRRVVLTISGAVVLMLTVASLGQLWQQKATVWSQSAEQIQFEQVRSNLPSLYGNDCDDWYRSAQVRICAFGDGDETEKTAVLFGDSVGAQWFSALANYYLQEKWRFIVLTKSSCPLVDEPIFYQRINAEYKVCELWRNAAVQYLTELQPDILFMGSTATYAFTSTQWQEGSSRILSPLAGAIGNIYIIRSTPRLPFDGPACLARKQWQPGFIAELADCSAAASTIPDLAVLNALQLAAGKFANVSVLDLNALVCPNGICKAYNGDKLVFRDNQHISDYYVQSIGAEIMQKIPAAN